jgi:branched-subunit amino acid aminotransferase/4-amino-4-deoxychorismate lyase
MAAWQWTGATFESTTSVPLSDRGFRYGMTLFESLRVANHEPQFLAEHLDRLRTACDAREFPVDEQAFARIEELLRGAGVNGFARIYVSAGDGDLGQVPTECRMFVFIEDRTRPAALEYHLGICEDTHHPLFGGLKTGNYWANLDALRAAQRAGLHETLLFNENGELISACLANVVLVKDGELRTPSAACGARRGVIRSVIASHMPVREGSLFVDDVMTADEIFLTSSWLGIMPAKSVAGHPLPSRAIGASLGQTLLPEFTGRL